MASKYPLIKSKVNWDESQAGMVQLQQAIYMILVGLEVIKEGDNDLVQKLLSAEAMIKYWIPCVTHKSITKDVSKNYEYAEFCGDKHMNSLFMMYIQANFPGQVDEAKGTWLINKYMSADFQGEITNNIGIDKLLKSDRSKISDDEWAKIPGDLCEAFFGTLINLINDKYIFTMGIPYAYNILKIFLDMVEIDVSTVTRDYVSLLQELFRKFRWGEVSYKSSPSNIADRGPMMVEVKKSSGELVGVGYGKVDKAKQEGAKQALESLEAKGFTMDYATENVGARREENKKEYDQYWQQVEEIKDRLLAKNPESFVSVKMVNQPVGKEFKSTIQATYKTDNLGGVATRNIISDTDKDQHQGQIRIMKKFIQQYGNI